MLEVIKRVNNEIVIDSVPEKYLFKIAGINDVYQCMTNSKVSLGDAHRLVYNLTKATIDRIIVGTPVQLVRGRLEIEDLHKAG